MFLCFTFDKCIILINLFLGNMPWHVRSNLWPSRALECDEAPGNFPELDPESWRSWENRLLEIEFYGVSWCQPSSLVTPYASANLHKWSVPCSRTFVFNVFWWISGVLAVSKCPIVQLCKCPSPSVQVPRCPSVRCPSVHVSKCPPIVRVTKCPSVHVRRVRRTPLPLQEGVPQVWK